MVSMIRYFIASLSAFASALMVRNTQTVAVLATLSCAITIHAQFQWSRQNSNLSGVCYGNGTYVAVGHDDQVWTSTDLSMWQRHSNGVRAELAAVAFGNGAFVAVGSTGCAAGRPCTYDGVILRSTNSVDWTEQSFLGGTKGLGGIPVTDVEYVNSEFLAVGGYFNVGPGYGMILSSPDGVTLLERIRNLSSQSLSVR